jgi:hypothetical protein
MDLPAVLDTVIGVVFVWFLLSLVVSGINEAFAWLSRVRSKQLWLAVQRGLEPGHPLPRRFWDIAWVLPLQFWKNPFDVRPTNSSESGGGGGDTIVQRLYDEVRDAVYDPAKPGRKSKVSRLPAATFSAAALALAGRVVTLDDLLSAPDDRGVAPVLTDDERTALTAAYAAAGGTAASSTLHAPTLDQLLATAPDTSHDLISRRYEAARHAVSPADVAQVLEGNPKLRAAVLAAMRGAGDNLGLPAAKLVLDDWFDGQMNQLSAWYRRQSRKILGVIAVAVVLLVHADTLDVVNRLQHDQALREAIATDAVNLSAARPADVKAGICVDVAEPTAADQYACAVKVIERTRVFSLPTATELREEVQAASGSKTKLDVLDGPAWLWDRVNGDGSLDQLPGLVVTAIALLFGADFWFSILRRLVGIRRLVNDPGGT